MGYDVHVTRAKSWLESGADPISLDQWLAYVEADPEMRFDGYAEASLPDGHSLRVESDGLAVWTAYSGNGGDANMAWFDWCRGRIVVKNPDEEIIGKMKRVAQDLGASVQGDEGELY